MQIDNIHDSCNKSEIYCIKEKEITEKFLRRFSVVYLHVVLLRMHKRYTATEEEFDIVLQMRLE